MAVRLLRSLLPILLLLPLALPAAAVEFDARDVIAVDRATDAADPRADLLSLSLKEVDGHVWLRVGLTGGPGLELDDFWLAEARLELSVVDPAGRTLLERRVQAAGLAKSGAALRGEAVLLDLGTALAPALAAATKADAGITIRARALPATAKGDVPLDVIEGQYPAKKVYEAHCALAHHGNQGLAYSDVFLGRSDDLEGSGFDEQLQVHESTGVPGNFHVSGTLITAAEWDHNQGNPVDFNGWLSSGVSSGWAAMLTSAYAQHIMPFVTDAMNSWAVNVQAQLVNSTYGYFPRTAWIPERVWLDPSRYPNAGVNDWPGDNFQAHGVYAVILDDDVHLSGWDNHQIHTLSNGLRVVPRDRNFTGNIVGGNGQAAVDILGNLANSGVGEFRIAVYAEDWEAAAEMGFWAGTTPNAKETYDWFVGKVASESWIHAWRIDDALSNPNFNGSTIAQLTPGSYTEIGGFDGYGGGDNGWYTHWAGYVPYVTGGDGYGNCAGTGGNCRDYGGMWSAAYNKLVTVPSNNLSEAGWYVMMTNLHETGWHDSMGGDISGWQHKYSAHVKNAMVYAEAARWAGGLYVDPTGAFASDVDEDGFDELILYNDRIFAVFEATGGRAVNVFAKGTGYDFSAVGVDNAYWYGTEADYNDGNHVGAFSDVSPDTQHQPYSWTIDSASGTTVGVTLTHGGGLEKSFELTLGEPYLRAVYRTGGGTSWVQTGMSPGLVDLIWNAQMDRVWAGDQAFMGRRNPNTGATVALVLGAGGASHQKEIGAQIMKGDEIYGSGAFEFYLFAAQTADPGAGEIPELRTLATALVDVLGPRVESAIYLPGTDRLQITFDQLADPATMLPASLAIDDDGDATPELTLSASTTVLDVATALTLNLELTAADATALEALSTGSLELIAAAGAVQDGNGVASEAATVPLVYGAETAVTLDGHVESGEWSDACFPSWTDDPDDSAWTSSNELEAVWARWDDEFLYLAVEGIVSGNSWILYLDTDPDGTHGQSDLTAIDAWERGATFAAGFLPDFQYGCYQHQGQYDSDSFFRIDSATTTTDLSGQIYSAFDSAHVYGTDGGSEIAIPWEMLYGLGPGNVPAGAEIAFAVSICWDPEPDGELGGDSIPSNTTLTLPAVEHSFRFTVDYDGDGLPDAEDLVGPQIVSLAQAFITGLPKRLNPEIEIEFDETVAAGPAENVANYTVYETALPSNTLTVLSAHLLFEGNVVMLQVDSPPYDTEYTVVVDNATDTSCNANVTATQSGTVDLVRVVATPPRGLTRAILYPNIPNPFNPSTLIRFALPDAGAKRVELTVFDLRGRRVRTLVAAQSLGGGEHERRWHGVDERGAPVASGEYLVRLRADDVIQTRKVSLAK